MPFLEADETTIEVDILNVENYEGDELDTESVQQAIDHW